MDLISISVQRVLIVTHLAMDAQVVAILIARLVHRVTLPCLIQMLHAIRAVLNVVSAQQIMSIIAHHAILGQNN